MYCNVSYLQQGDELLPLKNKLDEARRRIIEAKKAIEDILEHDDDLSMICFEGNDDQESHSNKDSDEVADALSGCKYTSPARVDENANQQQELPLGASSSSFPSPLPGSAFYHVVIVLCSI